MSALDDMNNGPKQMRVTSRIGGYAHCTLHGECSPDVTVEDIKERYYHPYFGGRDAWVKDGYFRVTIHTD